MFSIGIVTAVFLSIVSLIVGVILTLLLQWYFFNRYIMKQPVSLKPGAPAVEPYQLPKSLLEGDLKPEPAKALNSLLQFLFQECRDTERVRRWFRARLSLELEELLTRTTTGKLFEAIALRDLHLGSQFPDIHSVEIKQLSLNSANGLIDELELGLALEYRGGFQLTIDANMRLNKTARVSVKVKELRGLGCLRFTRLPYTHWAFSFHSDPQLALSVESHFQGRALPQINSIIASQIRKALKRKHTLPNYKLRYKPFFSRGEGGAEGVGEGEWRGVAGTLEVTVLQTSRLDFSTAADLTAVYCSLAVDNMAWVEMVHSESGSYLTVDVTVSKQGGALGINFKQEFVPDKYQVCFVVESVAGWVVGEVRVGDILVAVDGKRVTSLAQLSKSAKRAGDKVPLRLERTLRIVTPPADDKLLDAGGLRHRRGSGEKTDSDSSNSTSFSESPAKKMHQESPEHKREVIHRLSFGAELEQQQLQVLTTKDQPHQQVIAFNETLRFTLLSEHRFLNLSVWGRGSDGAGAGSLLGHVSLPLANLSLPSGGHLVNTHPLLPPHPHLINSSSHPLSSHNGFEPCLCYGDVLLLTCFSASGPSEPQPMASSSLLLPPFPSSHSLSASSNVHDFERTHFNRATQCGFCFKKIWLKDAFQCRGCAIACHKKCVSKCLAVTACGRRGSMQPEIVTTPAPAPTPQDTDGALQQTPQQQGRRLGALLSRGLKRVGSASSLAPPNPPGASGSVSLPPSPQHSPTPSRKTSLGEDGCVLFSLEGGDVGDEVSAALAQLLARPHDEELMDQAKATGRQLFADLAPDARKTRIDAVMAKLKQAMDEESQAHMRLSREEQTGPADLRARTAFSLVKSEERLHALTVLMLHCCAGLQDFHETLTLPTLDNQVPAPNATNPADAIDPAE